MTQLTPHYEIRQIIVNRQLPDAPVMLNVGIRYRDAQGEQVGPPSGVDVVLTGPQFIRASPSSRLTVSEDVVVAAAKTEIGSQDVTFVVPPVP